MENKQNPISNKNNQSDADQLRDTANSILTTITETLKGVLDLFKRKITFEEYLSATSDVIDKKIIDICKAEKIRYVGGTCTFRASKENQRIAAKLELFFQDTFGQWIKKEQKFSAPISVFTDEAKATAIKKMFKDELKINIDAP